MPDTYQNISKCMLNTYEYIDKNFCWNDDFHVDPC